MNSKLSHDPLWPRAGSWAHRSAGNAVDLAIIGVPTSATSLSPSNAHETPAAIRDAVRRYSSHIVEVGAPHNRGGERQTVLNEMLTIIDEGDLTDVDSETGEASAAQHIQELASNAQLLVALGGDNACTVPAALGVALAHGSLESAGLITLDAHHDLRDGRSNGSPIRRLIEMGMNPKQIVQVGIADFANSQAYRDRAKQLGITVIHRDEFFTRSIEDIAGEALSVAGAGGGPIHADLDVDVCDRSVAPACPASIPGGLQAHELRRITRILSADPRVRGIDIAEIDATADAPDGRTVRLAALLLLEAAAGLSQRLQRG